MGWFSRLFGLDRNEGSNVKSSPPPTASSSPPDYEYYLGVVDSVVVSDSLKSALRESLKRAFDDPGSLYEDGGDFNLSERGLTYPADAGLTPKFVFVDSLLDHDEMTEVDWKAEEGDVRFALNHVLKARDCGLQLSLDERYDDADTYEALEKIDEAELRPSGFALALLDHNGDSYLITVVSLDRQQEIEAMFDRLR